MAKQKSTQILATCKAVARVKEQENFQDTWGSDEHLNAFRYLVSDIIEASKETDKAKQAVEVRKALKVVFDADPEWSYASNFQKVLVAMGEITASAKKTGGYED
jgi:hypothetical protein